MPDSYPLGNEGYENPNPAQNNPLYDLATNQVYPFYQWTDNLPTTTTNALLVASIVPNPYIFSGDTWLTDISFLPTLNTDTLYAYVVIQANSITYYFPNSAPANIPPILTIMNLTLNSPKGIFCPYNSSLSVFGYSAAGAATVQVLMIGYLSISNIGTV